MDSSSSLLVDLFMVEALKNPRHRLTILRMELDIQTFLQNVDQQVFEFQLFPTSYLRLAAHRVAQHYGLQSLVQDTITEGMGNRIIVKKMAETKFPSVRLSELPSKPSENDKPENVKIAIRPRPNKNSINGANETGIKRNHVRTVEERKEDYDRARARIFSSSSSSDSDESMLQASPEDKIPCLRKEENEVLINDIENNYIKDGFNSRVAIFRDRDMDRSDPDYDRSYERYNRTFPVTHSMGPFNTQKIQLPFVQYDGGFPQYGQMPGTQVLVNDSTSSNANMNPFCAMGRPPAYMGAAYMQWPSPAMIYSQSYDQLRHVVFQAPFCQQPMNYS